MTTHDRLQSSIDFDARNIAEEGTQGIQNARERALDHLHMAQAARSNNNLDLAKGHAKDAQDWFHVYTKATELLIRED